MTTNIPVASVVSSYDVENAVAVAVPVGFPVVETNNVVNGLNCNFEIITFDSRGGMNIRIINPNRPNNIYHDLNAIQQTEITCMKILSSILMCVILVPFIGCDFYYSVNDITCQHIKGNNIHLTISEWLIVCGIYETIALIIPLYLLHRATNLGEYENKIKKLQTPILSLFTLSWLIVGAILFWNEILPDNCGKSVKSYLSAKIILGFIGNTFHHYYFYMMNRN